MSCYDNAKKIYRNGKIESYWILVQFTLAVFLLIYSVVRIREEINV